MKSLSLILVLLFYTTKSAAKEPILPSIPDNEPISRGQYITGGILGSAVGLGIGHAVQKRYSNIGWIFTATEVTGILLIAKGNCFRSRDSNSPNRAEREKSDCENTTEALSGAALYVGFHIWEVVDIWKNGNSGSAQSAVFMLPQQDGFTFSFNAKF